MSTREQKLECEAIEADEAITCPHCNRVIIGADWIED